SGNPGRELGDLLHCGLVRARVLADHEEDGWDLVVDQPRCELNGSRPGTVVERERDLPLLKPEVAGGEILVRERVAAGIALGGLGAARTNRRGRDEGRQKDEERTMGHGLSSSKGVGLWFTPKHIVCEARA